jgi:hypothetical protein
MVSCHQWIGGQQLKIVALAAPGVVPAILASGPAREWTDFSQTVTPRTR